MYRLGIVGSRSFSDFPLLDRFITTNLHWNIQETTRVVSGGARGADSLAKVFADKYKIPIIEYLPDWDKYGKRAGFIRNRFIVEDSDVVFAFWDGSSRGTKSTIDLCRELKVPCWVCMFDVIQKVPAVYKEISEFNKVDSIVKEGL